MFLLIIQYYSFYDWKKYAICCIFLDLLFSILYHSEDCPPSSIQELDYLVGAVGNPTRPFAAIVGGSKVSTKIGVIESLLGKVDLLLLGGGMIFTFYKAQGYSVGSSLVEEDKLELAISLLEKAKSKGVSLLLPSDVVVADKFAADANSMVCSYTFFLLVKQTKLSHRNNLISIVSRFN